MQEMMQKVGNSNAPVSFANGFIITVKGRAQSCNQTCTTYPLMHLKFFGWTSPLTSTIPCSPFLFLRPARMSSRLDVYM